MRAVIFGLIGAVLAVGGASAGCPVGRAVLVVTDMQSQYALNEPISRPDLVGEIFRVVRYVEAPEFYTSPRNGYRKNVGYEAYEIRGKRETFVIKRDHVDGSPAITVASAGSDRSKIGKIDWSRRQAKSVEFDENGELINFGPLSALTLELKSCR